MPIDTDLGEVTKHGESFASPRIQEGAVLNEDGFGMRVLNGTLLVKDTDSTSTLTGSNLPKIGDEVIKGSGLYISKMAKRYKWDGMIAADFEAVGIDPAYKGETVIAFDGASAASAEPIESHWKFKTDIGGTKDARLNGALFDEKGKFLGFSTDTSGSTVNSPDQPLAGVRSYLAPKETGRGYIHFSRNSGNASKYLSLKNAIGTQSRGAWFNVKLVPDWAIIEGTWLLTNASVEPIVVNSSGNPIIFKLTYEVTASGNIGWHRKIYAQG